MKSLFYPNEALFSYLYRALAIYPADNITKEHPKFYRYYSKKRTDREYPIRSYYNFE